jgi:hypothetical protein
MLSFISPKLKMKPKEETDETKNQEANVNCPSAEHKVRGDTEK